MTGLSGNEMYCLNLKGYRAGELIIGNSVHSLGFLGGIGAGLQNMFGGEVTQITQIIHEGRLESFKRLLGEAQKFGATGFTGVTSELRNFQGNIEFLSVASCVKNDGPPPLHGLFSSSSNGQELYCQIDAGYTPLHFVFGNVAYSTGIGGGLFGGLKAMARGEIKEFSDIFNQTRHLALRRIANEAKAAGGNAVVGIETRIMPFQGVHEMVMMGTASQHPALPAIHSNEPITSDLTCEEMWNLAAMGYAPLKLVLGTAVYSLGVLGGLKAMFKSFSRGEISDLTTLIYDAREHAIGMLRDEAQSIGADDVVGLKTHIHQMGGLIEFMAIGTAVKKLPGIAPLSPSLPPQAIIRDKDTWISEDDGLFAAIRSGGDSGGGGD
ncbi:MAG: heavy metal-binding domain-containing protein [Chthoniobacteraceae bacterium]